MKTLAGRYDLLETIALGDHLAYRAWDNRLKRAVTIRLPQPGSQPAMLARFRHEMRAMSALSHPTSSKFSMPVKTNSKELPSTLCSGSRA